MINLSDPTNPADAITPYWLFVQVVGDWPRLRVLPITAFTAASMANGDTDYRIVLATREEAEAIAREIAAREYSFSWVK